MTREAAARPRMRNAACAGVLVASFLSAAPATAASPVSLSATIDGRPVVGSTDSNPIPLDPTRPLALELQIDNRGLSDVFVRTVRLQGRVIGLTFFAYETSVSFRVPASGLVVRRFALDLTGLSGQAMGLIPGEVKILDERRAELSAQRLVIDVRGSLGSVYGIFGLAVGALTLFSLAGALLALARHRLSRNRIARGLRFLGPGVGIGFSAVFTLSALRIFAPSTGRWSPIVLASGAVLFVVGYVTPTPVSEVEEVEGEAEEFEGDFVEEFVDEVEYEGLDTTPYRAPTLDEAPPAYEPTIEDAGAIAEPTVPEQTIDVTPEPYTPEATIDVTPEQTIDVTPEQTIDAGGIVPEPPAGAPPRAAETDESRPPEPDPED